MALASAHLLARIVADGEAALLGRFDTLAVEDRRRRRGLAALGDTHLHAQSVVEFFPKAALAPGREVSEDRGFGRKVLGQHVPLTAAAVEKEDGVEDDSARVLDRSPAAFGFGNERFEEFPFAIREVTGIGLGRVHPKLDVWKLWCVQVLNAQDFPDAL